MKKLLALLPSPQDRRELDALADKGIAVVYLDDPGWRSYDASLQSFDPIEFVRKGISMGKEHAVDGIFFTEDLANFCGAVMGQALNLPTPSVEAMFLANHKYYSRSRERHPIRFQGFRLDQDDWMRDITFPSHLKPPSLFFSLLQTTVTQPQELAEAVAELREKLPAFARPYKELFSRYVDADRFPLAMHDMFMAEEFVSCRTQHAVEGWTDAEGRHAIWAVSDNNYFDGVGSALDNNSVPSRLGAAELDRVVQAALDAVENIGIKNGFWNVELWVLPNDDIRITEINGRACVSMTALYKQVFGKSQYALIAKLAAGLPIEASDAAGPPKGVGGMFAVSTSRQGYVRDLLDEEAFAQVQHMPGIVRTAQIFPGDAYIDWHQTGGRSCLARFWLVGESYEAIAAQAREIRARVLKDGMD
ncbi:ATP-grasp domain-containing protein [Roseateles sp. DB2]|uniref:ATP-grasp domain-containing protein n=1 Tax=Roseateles sp. DB2 TaxID=3453717 RepID=UPI003EEDFCB8